jgi:hypothetical protein
VVFCWLCLLSRTFMLLCHMRHQGGEKLSLAPSGRPANNIGMPGDRLAQVTPAADCWL